MVVEGIGGLGGMGGDEVEAEGVDEDDDGAVVDGDLDSGEGDVGEGETGEEETACEEEDARDVGEDKMEHLAWERFVCVFLPRGMADYPSWLPTRPPPPPPQDADDDDDSPVHGRPPASRSVRIVNLAVHPPPKAWARPSVPAPDPVPRPALPVPLPQPRFHAKNLNIDLLRSPDPRLRLYFYLWPLLVFYHIPLQSFFDFNAVYILLQVTKYPHPDSSTRSWALATTAYIACWLVWILIVLLTYEVIYSFARRWRLRTSLRSLSLLSHSFSQAVLSSSPSTSPLPHST